MSEKELKARVREIPLMERLEQCRGMIGNMCSELRPPKMSIPVRWNDEDFFISTTIQDAMVSAKTCLWSRADEDTDMWETSCDQAYILNEGTPKENDMNFCTFCGKMLEEASDKQDVDA